MDDELKIIRNIGVLISASQHGCVSTVDMPEGDFAAVVTANGEWFSIDVSGNVRGNPEAVEREALSLGADNLMVGAAVGLARLALRNTTR